MALGAARRAQPGVVGAVRGCDGEGSSDLGELAREHPEHVVGDRQVVDLRAGLREPRDRSARADVVVVVVRLHAQDAPRGEQIGDRDEHRAGA